MAISAPQLISCSALIDETVVIRAGDDSFIFAFKNHKGSPRREAEVFTVAAAQAAPPFSTGTDFDFGIDPIRIEILDQVFRFVSSILITDTVAAPDDDPIVRFYWNQIAGTQTGNNPILQVDYNTITNEKVGSVSTLPFEGLDPFVMDARTLAEPLRLYMLYVEPSTAKMALRVSRNLGVTWSDGCFFDSDVVLVEGVLQDPETLKESLRVLQRRDSATDDAYLADFTTSAVDIGGGRVKKLYPRFRRPPRIDTSTGRDLNRFREMYPLVRRVVPSATEEPC